MLLNAIAFNQFNLIMCFAYYKYMILWHLYKNTPHSYPLGYGMLPVGFQISLNSSDLLRRKALRSS